MTTEIIEAKWKQRNNAMSDLTITVSKKETLFTLFVKNFQSGDKWMPGVIRELLLYGCLIHERCCHQDQLQKRTVEVPC